MTSTTSDDIGKHFRNQFGQRGAIQRHDMQEELVFLRGALDGARSEISQLKDILRENPLFLKVVCYISKESKVNTASPM
jgi:hypothetical protein